MSVGEANAVITRIGACTVVSVKTIHGVRIRIHVPDDVDETAVRHALDEAWRVEVDRRKLSDVERIDYDSLDPGIRRVVSLLNELGFSTCDSGDGVSKPKGEGVIDIPHVFHRTNRPFEAAQNLLNELRRMGIRVDESGHGPVWIEASQDPVSGVGLVGLYGLNDAGLPPDVRS